MSEDSGYDITNQANRIKNNKECIHEKLTWSSGGHFILCKKCNATWVACLSINTEKPTPESVIVDYGRSHTRLVGDIN